MQPAGTNGSRVAVTAGWRSPVVGVVIVLTLCVTAALTGGGSQSSQPDSAGAASGSQALPASLGPRFASGTRERAPSTALSAATGRRVTLAYTNLPLAFIPNAGQTDEQVRYYAQGAGYSFRFTDDKAVLALQTGDRGHVLDLRFLGANPNAELTATGQSGGTVNYLTGSERQSNLPTYGRVIYRELWPGIDMVFWGKGGKLTYEFRLRPGARVSDIRLAYAGAEGVSLGASGNLLIDTPLGILRDAPPQSSQRIDGRHVPVDSRYALAGNSYGFAVGDHDRRHPLVIGPSLAYSTYLGGSSGDLSGGIAVDSTGAAYVTGQTISTDFPTTPGAFRETSLVPGDVFVTKLNPDGSSLAYSSYLGGSTPNPQGSNVDGAFGIAVDSAGAAYVTGVTPSSDFPTTAGAFDTSFNGFADAFVAKLNPDGSSVAYSTYLGGTSSNEGVGIAVDSAGAAYVTGGTTSTDFPTTAEAFDTNFNGDDGFVTKLNPAGSDLAYSTYLGGSSGDGGRGIAVDSAGAAYVTGDTISTDFPTTPGAFDTSFNGFADAFVTKLDPAGSRLGYSSYLGASNSDDGIGIAVDSTGAAYVTGHTDSTDFPTTARAFDASANGNIDAFVTKLTVGAPPSTQQCNVTNGGRITADNGDRAIFGGNARSDAAANLRGQQRYNDQGPAQPLRMTSIRISALTCNEARTQASIFGEATIDGSDTRAFRIDVQDLGDSGVGIDTYRIMLDTGYDSGAHTLQSGNVQIQKS
jgi:hypothetical protein